MNEHGDALVLNVNDDEATRYLYSNILRRGGYRVLEAANGETALRLVGRERPDLVLLDVRLPDLSGLEVCRRIKSDPHTATILVVQTSATFASLDRRIEGLDSGADAYLAQPIESVELLATIRAMLRTRKAETSERRTGRKLQRTFDAMRDAVLIVDPTGTIVHANESASRLVGGGELVGRTANEALARAVDPNALASLLRNARGGRHEVEVTEGGRWLRVSVDPIESEDGASEGTVVVLTDVTDGKRLAEEHKRRAEELSEAARRKDEFLGMLAHELRNPLNAISAANVILDRLGPHDDSSVRLRNVISRQTRNLARMVDDLLEVSRITRGKIQIRKQGVDLAQVVRQAVQGSQPLLDGRKQTVKVSLPSSPVLLDGDDLRLEQVVMNLIGNASKYSEPGTEIDVKLAVSGDSKVARLSVRDAGVGIPPSMLDAIFEPFVQVDQSLARSLGGLGIGLTMVKSLVELHGGRAKASSDGPGRGAEFVIELPVAGAAAPAAGSEASLGEAESKGLRILVVEDNPDTLELLETWLGMLGHTVHAAADGRAGLELAMSVKPDVAFVDIGLPVLDGFEVAKNIRAAEGCGEIFLVAVTGYGRPEDRARALDAGFDDYIVKPIDERSLTRVLERPVRDLDPEQRRSA